MGMCSGCHKHKVSGYMDLLSKKNYNTSPLYISLKPKYTLSIGISKISIKITPNKIKKIPKTYKITITIIIFFHL